MSPARYHFSSGSTKIGHPAFLTRHNAASKFSTGSLERPLGRGINFEVQVENLDPALQRIMSAGWPVFIEPEEKWYRAGDIEIGVRQFLVQDPDGYLLRLQQEIGERPAGESTQPTIEVVKDVD